MDELIAGLIKQAFKSMEEQIEGLKKEVEELKAYKADQEELNKCVADEFDEVKKYIQDYVSKNGEDYDVLEEYKYGEKDKSR